MSALADYVDDSISPCVVELGDRSTLEPAVGLSRRPMSVLGTQLPDKPQPLVIRQSSARSGLFWKLLESDR